MDPGHKAPGRQWPDAGSVRTEEPSQKAALALGWGLAEDRSLRGQRISGENRFMASLDHIGLSVSDYAAAKAFYVAALSPLGISVQMEFSKEATGDFDAAGFGVAGKPFFWLSGSGKRGSGKTGPGTHIAFAATSRAEVDAFYKAAMAAGGKDNGAPGVRPHYHDHYYGAFVLDGDGNNV
jgi:catechol 2,3-dioxygenase-like lactoylglutathione lyase family enzyme